MRPSWQVDALCRKADPNLYDLDWVEEAWGITEWRAQDEYAAQMCAGCPVMRECARDALEPFDVGDYACVPEFEGLLFTEGVVRAGLALRPVAAGKHSRRSARLGVVAGVGFVRPRARRGLVCVLCGEVFGDRVAGGVKRRSVRVCVGCAEGKVAV